jgi:hypothetical protein
MWRPRFGATMIFAATIPTAPRWPVHRPARRSVGACAANAGPNAAGGVLLRCLKALAAGGVDVRSGWPSITLRSTAAPLGAGASDEVPFQQRFTSRSDLQRARLDARPDRPEHLSVDFVAGRDAVA